MGPDSAEHLEILEELRACTALPPLHGRTDTCSVTEGKETVYRVVTALYEAELTRCEFPRYHVRRDMLWLYRLN